MGQATHASITGPVTTAIRVMEADHDPRRRLVLSALAAAPFVPRPAVGREAHPDAALLGLKARWEAAEAAYSQACRITSELHDATTFPPLPAAIFVQEGDCELRLANYARDRNDGRRWYMVEPANSELRGLRRQFWRDRVLPAAETDDRVPRGHTIVERTPWPEAQARADEIVAAWDGYQAAREAALDASGYNAAQRESDRCGRLLSAIEDELKSAVPQTLAGLAVLADFAQRYQTDIDEDDALGGVLARAILAVTKPAAQGA